MLLNEVLTKSIQFFKDKKIESARLDAELLISSALNLKRIDLYLRHDQPLKENEVIKCREFVRRRSLGEPVAYILGVKAFYNQEFLVTSSVLIPRPESELMVEEALNWIQAQRKKIGSEISVLDLGCGSGCLGLTILKNTPNSILTAIDLSPDALSVAKQNAEKLEILDRVEFLNADAATVNLKGKKFDVIIANPPYIAKNDLMVEENVKKFEPSLALFAEENGLQCIKDWVANFSQCLNSNAIFLCEFGFTQGLEVQKIFELQNAFSRIEIKKDLGGHDRYAVGVCHG